MPEGITAENLLNNIMDTLSDGAPKHKSSSFFQEESESSVTTQLNRLFGRQKPIHHCLGGGKCMVVYSLSSLSHYGCIAMLNMFPWICSC